MKIYVDETGVFKVDEYASSTISGVGALVIPDYRAENVKKKYLEMRKNFPKDKKGEVKGKLLSGTHISKVVELLRKNDCLFEMNIIDMMGEREEALESHRAGQIRGLSQNLSSQHHPNIHKAIGDLQEQLAKMPIQLYVQAVVSTDVLNRIFNHALTYYALRQPKELAYFEWIIDAKNNLNITSWETWWKKVLKGFLQSKSLNEPSIRLRTIADYSYLDKYKIPYPEWLPHRELGGDDDCMSLNEIFNNFQFIGGVNYGLELVDVLTNSVRRACMGNYDSNDNGWENISTLIIRKSNTHRINVLSLTSKSGISLESYSNVIKKFDRSGRSLLTESAFHSP
jgi:hypothetical protein